MRDINELRAMNSEELQSELISLRREQLNLRIKNASGSLDKKHLITKVRKSVARVKTIISEKVGKGHGK